MFNKKHRIFGYSSQNSGPLVVPPPEKNHPDFRHETSYLILFHPTNFMAYVILVDDNLVAKPNHPHSIVASNPAPCTKYLLGPNHKNTSGPFLLPPTSSTLISVQSMLLDDVATAAFNALCKEINTHFPELLNHLLCLILDYNYNMRPKYNQIWAVTTNLC